MKTASSTKTRRSSCFVGGVSCEGIQVPRFFARLTDPLHSNLDLNQCAQDCVGEADMQHQHRRRAYISVSTFVPGQYQSHPESA